MRSSAHENDEIEEVGKYILRSVKANNLTLTHQLLLNAKEHKQPWDIWYSPETENYAIHEAIKNKNLDMLKLLIAYGANIHKKNEAGETPLMLALKGQDTSLIIELLKCDDHITNVGSYILEAAHTDNLILAIELCEYASTHKKNLNYTQWVYSSSANTPLHLAVKHQNLEMVKLLVSHGADIYVKNKAEKTPYLLALETKNAPLIAYLSDKELYIKKDYNPDEVKSAQDLFSFNIDEISTPTFLLSIANTLKTYKGRYNLQESALLEPSDKKIEKIDLEKHHTFCEKLQSFYDQAVFGQAIKDGDLTAVKSLLNLDLLNQVLCKEKFTPFEVAMKYGKKDIAEYLLLNGAHRVATNKESKIQDSLNSSENQEAVFTSTVENMQERNNYALSVYKKMLAEDKEIEIAGTVREFFTLAKDITLLIDEALKELNLYAQRVTANETVDLTLLINSLLSALESVETCSEFEKRVKLILSEREDAILNTSLDYCYSNNSIANRLCYGLVKYVFKTDTPENILLAGACTKDRFGTLANVRILHEQEFKTAKAINPEYGCYTLILGKKDFYIQTANFSNEAIIISSEAMEKDTHLKHLIPAVAALSKNKTLSDISEMDQEAIKTMTEIIKIYHTTTPEKWFDPAIGTEGTRLPAAKYFFRLPGNEIHLYQYVVNQAIMRLKDNNKFMEHIWFGTDAKNITPVPPLSLKTLGLLKQRSQTLKKLITYTELLDKDARDYAQGNVYAQFEMLKNGLFAGDYKVTGSHKTAGAAAYVTIAKFADWWNDLKQRRPDLCEQIRGLSFVRQTGEGEQIENMGLAIDILFDQTNIHNTERTENANYCIHLKANRIARLLSDKGVYAALGKIELEKKSDLRMKPVSHEELDAWEKQINQELEEIPPMLVSDFGGFPRSLKELQITRLMISKGTVQSYRDIFVHKDMKHDAQALIKYIVAEKDNKKLEDLHAILLRPSFNYLRQHGKNNFYYAYVGDQRIKTSRCYALIQKTLSNQMVYNVTANKKSVKEAHTAVAALYLRNPFIKYNIEKSHPKIFFNNLFSNSYAFSTLPTIFNGSKNLKESKEELRNYLSTLQSRAMSL